MSSVSMQKMSPGSRGAASSPSDSWTEDEHSAGMSPTPVRGSPRPPSPDTAFRESLRKLRPPGLELMLSRLSSEKSGPEEARLNLTSRYGLSPSEPEPPDYRRWGTFPRRKRSGWSASSSSCSPVDGTPVALDDLVRPRRRYLWPEPSNQSMLLQEAISASLLFTPGAEGMTDMSSSPHQELESTSYYSPVLPDFYDTISSSRLPSNVKELQMNLKAAQDECFTLKMSLHFMEEDYKRKFGAEDLSKENVKLKVDNAFLKDVLTKKDQLLHNALLVLKRSESNELTTRENEWVAEKRRMEERMKEMQQLWAERVAELEHRLGLASEATSADSAPSSSSTAVSSDSKVVINPDKAQSPKSDSSSSKRDLSLLALKENLKRLNQQMKDMRNDHTNTMKAKDQELYSLHSAVKEKDHQIQLLFLERDRQLMDTHQKVADLMALCSAKDSDISRLKTLVKSTVEPGQDDNNNVNNGQALVNEDVTRLVAQINELNTELENTKEEKCRVVEEAEIMDQQQQELSEQIEVLNQELRTLRREKMEMAAQMAAAEQNLAARSSCSSCSSLTDDKKGDELKRKIKKGGAREEGHRDRRKLVEEVKKLRQESSEKEERLRKALLEVEAFQKKEKETLLREEKAQMKLTTTKSSSTSLSEPKQRRTSTSLGRESTSHLLASGKPELSGFELLPGRLLHAGTSPATSLSICENSFLKQNLENLSAEQLRDRLLHTEALCWSMQSHLEDMAEFFTALLGDGDLKRFEKTLTPKEVKKLKSLVDRTMSISFTNKSQNDLLLDFTSASIAHESEPENQSRDRDISVVSIISHVRPLKDFVTDTETDSVAVLSSSCGEPSGRSRRSRLSSTADQSQLTYSLVQGLLEVMRQAERSAKKLGLELETFGQSHLYTLLIEETLDKLKPENLVEGSTPGREWEEVSQELESFQSKSQEVVHAASLIQSCLKEGLEHLSKTSESMLVSVQPPHQVDNGLLSLSATTSKDKTEGVETVSLDKSWVRTLVDLNYQLALKLNEDAKQLSVIAGRNSQANDICSGQLSNDLLNLWSGRDEGLDSFSWYNEKLTLLPKAIPLLQQVVQTTFFGVTKSLHNFESVAKDASERLKSLEACEESRSKEFRQVQDWNLRLQAEQTSKETLLQTLKANEAELTQKVKEQTEDIEKLLADLNRCGSSESLKDQLSAAISDLKLSEFKEAEMMSIMQAQKDVIDRVTGELHSEKENADKLSSQLETVRSQLETIQERERTGADLLGKATLTKNELELAIRTLRTQIEKLTLEKSEIDLNARQCLADMTATLEDVQTKVSKSKAIETNLKEEIQTRNDEIQRLTKELELKMSSVHVGGSTSDDVHGQLDNALSRLRSAEFREQQMTEKFNIKDNEIEILVTDLESKKKAVKRLESQLDTTIAKMENVESREKMMSEMLDKALQAKNDLEVSVQSLKAEVQKQMERKFEADIMNSKMRLDSVTAKLKDAEQQCTVLQQELSRSQAKYNDSQIAWKQQLDKEHLQQMELEKKLKEATQAIDSQKTVCPDERLQEKLESALQRLTSSQELAETKTNELETLRLRVTTLEKELQELKEQAIISVPEMEAGDSKEGSADSTNPPHDLEVARKQLILVSAQCDSLREELSKMESQVRLQVSETEEKWKSKINLLEQDAVRLREDVQQMYHLNQDLQTQISNYEEKIRTVNQKPLTDTTYSHPFYSDDGVRMSSSTSTKLEKSKSQPAGDLLGEMRQLKKEVVLNSHSSARLCRELQQHGRPCSKQHCPLSSASFQRSPPQHKVTDHSSSSSPDSRTVEARRKLLLEGINGESSSGTGSAETLTLLTASSEASISSNPATSGEDLGALNPSSSLASTKLKRVAGFATASVPANQVNYSSRKGSVVSEERWNRKSSPEDLSRTSSDSSLLHLRVLRHLGGSDQHGQDSHLDSVSVQDSAQNDTTSPFIQYEGPLVLTLVTSSCPDKDGGGGDAKDTVMQRSNYSSPDLGIESDPNMVSSRSSSTSSSDSRPVVSQVRSHLMGRINSSSSEKSDRQADETLKRQSAVDLQQVSPRRTDLLETSQEAVSVSKSYSLQLGKAEHPDNQSDSPCMVLHGLCALRDLELLRQELEEALVTLQGTKAAVRSRLDSNKLSSPAKSLEYSTLKEVDLRCLQLSEYLLRCKKLLETFKTLPVVTSPPQSCPLVLQGHADEQMPHLVNSNELSLTASTETVRYKDEMQKDPENTEFLKNQVLNLQNKLHSLEKRYREALEQLKANQDKTKVVNRALEKQLKATTKVIKMAKGNLKQAIENQS